MLVKYRVILSIYISYIAKTYNKEITVNCWEFMQCGREAGGRREEELGTCPAYPDHGKQCARVAGTMCEDRLQGFFARKILTCLKCDFYNSLHYERSLSLRQR
jgi:hypothetical protein